MSDPLEHVEIAFSGTGQFFHHHPKVACEGEHCPFHRPSAHHMATWPMNLRTDLGVALVERICPHGIGHPDPDSVVYLEQHFAQSYDIHGCDGCCFELGTREPCSV